MGRAIEKHSSIEVFRLWTVSKRPLKKYTRLLSCVHFFLLMTHS